MSDATTPPSDEGPPPIVGPRYFPGGERVAFFVVLASVLGATLYMLWPILVGPLLALAIGSLVAGPTQRLVRRIGPRTAASLVVVGLVLVVFVPLGLLVGSLAGRLGSEVAALVPRVGELTTLADRIAPAIGPFGEPLRRAAAGFTRNVADALPSLAQSAGSIASTLGNLLVKFGVGLLLFCITLYYFLVEGRAWRQLLVRLLPLRPENTLEFMSNFREVSVAVLVGGLGTTLAQSVTAGIGYWMIGVDAPLFWAILTGVASFIPAIGTALVFVPLALMQGLSGSWLRAGALLAFGVIVIGLVDNIVRPLLVRSGMQMHPLLIFLSMFGGLATFGPAGLFVGPLLMAITVAALKMYQKIPADPPAAAVGQ